MPRLLMLLCACVVIAAPALADEVLFTNGDHVTGTVSSMSGNSLTLATPHGQLRIAWTSIAGLVVSDPILVTVAGRPAAEARILAGDGPGRALLEPGGPVELAQ